MTASRYVNFELLITAQAGGNYRATVTGAPRPVMGETPIGETFRFPPAESDELERMLAVLAARGKTAHHQETARRFGESLFNAVFTGEVLVAYRATQKFADRAQQGVRLRLNTGRGGRLSAIPWEFLRDPVLGDYLALSRGTPVVRYNPQLVSKARLKVELPLRILVMISAPEGLPEVDVAMERRNMERATARLRQRGLVDLVFVEDASLRNLQRHLRQAEFHVFHYIGHGAYTPSGGGLLILEDPYEHRRPYPIRGEALARELYEEPRLRLVILNACQGAKAEASDPFSGVASSLVQRGIPAVVAQQFEISDKAALIFSEEFYRAVAEGFSLEEAIAEARRAIIGTLGNTEWATPVLFSHQDDTREIFGFQHRADLQALPLLARLRAQGRLSLVGLVAACLLFIGGVALASAWLDRESAQAAFPPPTATPLPDVDLLIRDISFSPRYPRPGEVSAVFIEIENGGQDAAPPFTLEWQANLFDPTSAVRGRVEGLAAGGVMRHTLAIRLGWWGAFLSEARVDVGDEIVERAETNNTRRTPLRTDDSQPFRVDFSEALPDGGRIVDNQPVPLTAYEAWGFRIEAEPPPNRPDCRDVVAWYKFVGVGQIVVGTGLPDDAKRCANAPLLITFDAQRPDNNRSGVGQVSLQLAGGAGWRMVTAFADTLGTRPLSAQQVLVSRIGAQTSLQAPFGSLERTYKVRIDPYGAEQALAGFSFTAP